MNRIFCFGCSYTEYTYPTWADLIVCKDPKNHFNFGFSGCSNQTISQLVFLLDKKFKFTSDDKIFILWTSFWRQNYLNKDGSYFKYDGNVFMSEHKKEYLKNYVNFTDMTVKNYVAIQSVNDAFNNVTNMHWKIPGIEESNEIRASYLSDNEKMIMNHYIPSIPIDKHAEHDDKKDVYLIDDGHPTIPWHYSLASELVDIPKEVKKWAWDIHKILLNLRQEKTTRQSFNDTIGDRDIWSPIKIKPYLNKLLTNH